MRLKLNIVFIMKKLKHYPSAWQAYPFSMELFAHFEEEARFRNKQTEIERQREIKEKKPRLKFAFGLW